MMFSLLLGREIGSASRWLSETQPATIAPTVARLLFVLKTLLQNQGRRPRRMVEQAQLEAQARGLAPRQNDLVVSRRWRAKGIQPRPPVQRRSGTRKKSKKPPKATPKETPDAADDPTPATE